MQGIIYLKGLRALLDPQDPTIERKPFDVKYCQLDGLVIDAKNITCTSSNFENDTLNFKFPDSNEFRTVHASLLLKVNGKEVML